MVALIRPLLISCNESKHGMFHDLISDKQDHEWEIDEVCQLIENIIHSPMTFSHNFNELTKDELVLVSCTHDERGMCIHKDSPS